MFFFQNRIINSRFIFTIFFFFINFFCDSIFTLVDLMGRGLIKLSGRTNIIALSLLRGVMKLQKTIIYRT
jgi:hypothetical protein